MYETEETTPKARSRGHFKVISSKLCREVYLL